MNSLPFFKYFFGYILHAKTRQRLLFIAVLGLFISGFSLMVIQGIMGGLQKGLIQRSKNIHGDHLIQLSATTTEHVEAVKRILTRELVPFVPELEIEVMIKHKGFVAPAKLHGIDLESARPGFLQDKDFTGLVMGADLASRVKMQFLDEAQIIAPGVTDSLLGEVPRFVSEALSDYLYTELSEVDEFEMWARLGFVQNLMRQRGINQIRIFGQVPGRVKQEILGMGADLRWLSWEDMNQALVWSLNLETKVMLFLFISMSLLVAIAITSGLLIFYSKIRRDLMSFWILGMAQHKLIRLCYRFTLIISAITCVLGVVAGQGALLLLEHYGHDLMPDIFVERRLPVEMGVLNILLSLVIPFSISLIFSYFSFALFRKENQSFVAIVRSLG
jgi:lipoprotein-releasing system permease protein